MAKKRTIWTIGSILLVAGGVWIAAFLMWGELPTTNRSVDKTSIGSAIYKEAPTAHLYFSDKENTFLRAENRVLPPSNDAATLGNLIVDALIKGPQEGFMQTVPPGTTRRALYITGDGTAYVDFTENIRENHPGGVQSELMTIFSIVNSLVLNIPEIRTVKILIGGGEAMTLAGHIDLRFPFKANMLMVR